MTITFIALFTGQHVSPSQMVSPAKTGNHHLEEQVPAASPFLPAQPHPPHPEISVNTPAAAPFLQQPPWCMTYLDLPYVLNVINTRSLFVSVVSYNFTFDQLLNRLHLHLPLKVNQHSQLLHPISMAIVRSSDMMLCYVIVRVLY
jgi:hypothetical protein